MAAAKRSPKRLKYSTPRFTKGLDFVVDGGVRVAEPSTIVDMTGPYPKVIREGKGPILPWMVVEDDDSRLPQDLIASGT